MSCLHEISPSPSLVIVFSHDIVSWFFQTAVNATTSGITDNVPNQEEQRL
jgi:hypothetical protein